MSYPYTTDQRRDLMTDSPFWDEEGWRTAVVLPSCDGRHSRLFKYEGNVARPKLRGFDPSCYFWSASPLKSEAAREFEAVYGEAVFDVKLDITGIPLADLPRQSYFQIVKPELASHYSFKKAITGEIQGLAINPPDDLEDWWIVQPEHGVAA